MHLMKKSSNRPPARSTDKTSIERSDCVKFHVHYIRIILCQFRLLTTNHTFYVIYGIFYCVLAPCAGQIVKAMDSGVWV